MNPIPVILLTGFLGAGKTTLINQVLRSPAFSGSAVLVNELGSIPLDHDLISEVADDLILTRTGCLCCTASSDIKQALFELWNRRRNREIRSFIRVIVETSGLVDPAPVIASLLAPPNVNLIDRTVATQFALARVVTLVDMLVGMDTLETHTEALKQVALADTIAITKADFATAGTSTLAYDSLRRRIGRINPAAVILDRRADFDVLAARLLAPATYDLRNRGEDALAWLAAERTDAHGNESPHDHHHHHLAGERHDDGGHGEPRHGQGISTHTITLDRAIDPPVLYFFLDALKFSAGSNMLRMKGLVNLSDDPSRPVVVHGVQHIVHEIDRLDRWPSNDTRTRIVLIGQDLDIDSLKAILEQARSRSTQTMGDAVAKLAATFAKPTGN